MTNAEAMRKSGPLGLALMCLAATLLAADGPSMSVFVTAAKVEARPEVDDATKNALKKKRDEANKARQALEKQIKEQFGKKREAWPPEKDEELYRLEEAAAVADAAYEYRKIDPKEIGDAVDDVRGAAEGKGAQAGKKDRITIASSAAEADLVVEVSARRSKKQFGAVTPSDCWVLFSVGPGGRTSPARSSGRVRDRTTSLMAGSGASTNSVNTSKRTSSGFSPKVSGGGRLFTITSCSNPLARYTYRTSARTPWASLKASG